MSYYLILFFIFLSLLSRLNLRLSILVLIAILPSYLIRFHIGPFPTTLLEISIIIIFLSWIIENRKNIFPLKLKRKENTRAYPFAWEIIIILIVSFSSIFIGGLSSAALGIFKAYFLEPIILFILILNNFKGKQGFKQIVNALSLSILIISIIAIWQKITGQFIFNSFWAEATTRRVVSVFGYPNALALFIAPILPLILASIKLDWKSKKTPLIILKQIFLSLSFLSGLTAIYFSKSKGAILALIISALIVLIITLKKRLKIALLLILSILSLFLYLQKDWWQLKLSASLSYQVRIAQWNETITMLKDGNIIYGSGLAKYQEKIKPYHQEGIFFNREADPDFKRKIIIFDDKYRAERWQPLEIYLYPHNIFLNFWTELGLAGLIIFSFLIFKFIFLSLKYYYQTKKDRNFLGLALSASMLIILLHGLVDVPYFKNDLSALFWIIISLLALLNYEKNKY